MVFHSPQAGHLPCHFGVSFPQDVQKNYNLYNNKIHADKNIADAIEDLQKMLSRIGYTIKVDRGDHRRTIC